MCCIIGGIKQSYSSNGSSQAGWNYRSRSKQQMLENVVMFSTTKEWTYGASTFIYGLFQKDENDFVRLGGKWRISIASTVPYCYDNNRILQRVEKIEFLKLHLVVNVVSLAFGRCKLQCRSSISFTTQAKEVCSRKGLTPRIHLAFPISHLT